MRKQGYPKRYVLAGIAAAAIFYASAFSADSFAAGNLVINPSLEQSSGANAPTDWIRGRWGTNTAVFEYPVAGAAGQGARVRITDYATGDAKWVPKEIPVEGGATYVFRNSYMSDVTSHVTLQIRHSNGSTSYMDLAALSPAATWKGFEKTFTLPGTAASVAVFHLIKQVGELSVDEYSFEQSQPAPPPPPPADPDNLIQNPSFEAVNSSGLPSGWIRGRWGTNTAVFEYPVAGAAGQGARVRITDYATGDAKWAFSDVPVQAGARYSFKNQYISTVPTQVTAQFKNSAGAATYLDLGTVPASSSWRGNSFSFTAPPGAVTVSVFHVLKAVGTLTVDDYSLVKDSSAPPSIGQGAVTLTFDDGWKSIYQNAIPILNAAGIKSTQYIITGRFGYPGYVTQMEVLSMQAAGHEIGSHTVTHRDLALLSAAERDQEIQNSISALRSFGANVRTFAYPFGSYNSAIIQVVGQTGYETARSTDNGFNAKGQLVTLALKRHPVNFNTTFEQVKQLIDSAKADGTWLVLVFHRVDQSGTTYSATPETLQKIVDYLKQTNTKVVTISEGYSLMKQ